MKAVLIYFLRDPINPKKGYVGQTIHWKRRLGEHIKEARTKKRSHKLCWLRSLLSKGLKPEFEHVAQVSEIGWEQHEIDHIAAFRSMGYALTNTTPGGDSRPDRTGRKHTPETRAKIGAAQTGEKGNMFGKHHSLETRAKMGAIQSGGKNHFFGKKHTPETIAKLSAAGKLRARNASGNWI